jgi:fibro-slime domain-containing protein
VYAGGEIFNYTGDDDVFVYINGYLAIDLGGLRSTVASSIELDNFPFITLGQNYKYVYFLIHKFLIFFSSYVLLLVSTFLNASDTLKLVCLDLIQQLSLVATNMTGVLNRPLLLHFKN